MVTNRSLMMAAVPAQNKERKRKRRNLKVKLAEGSKRLRKLPNMTIQKRELSEVIPSSIQYQC